MAVASRVFWTPRLTVFLWCFLRAWWSLTTRNRSVLYMDASLYFGRIYTRKPQRSRGLQTLFYLELQVISSNFKSDFLRVSRIGRHSQKIDFSFISPKDTFRWTYSRKNSLKFQRFILRPKFKKVRNLHIMAVFTAQNVQNFTLLYKNSGGVKTILWKRNLAQILFHSYTLNSCN